VCFLEEKSVVRKQCMDAMTLSSFGDLLKTLRKQSRVNQQELASRLGVHLNTISKWERGICLPESKTIVLELAHQLHLNPHDTRLLLEASLTALSPYWHLPYQRNPFFTGREEVLQRVHEALHQQQSALLSQSSALSGLGGIGKTQTAIEYAYRYANDYTAVFWISAETTESLTSSFLALAEVLNLPERHDHEQQRVISAVLRWLNTHSDWLLVFDNVEDIELVKSFLPSSRGGSLLFTSRRKALGITAQALNLHQMTLEEGMRLLLHRARLLEPTASLEQLDEHERAAAQELVTLMDGLPLALDQAGAYIEETQCRLSDYLHLFQASSLDLLDEREGYADHPISVARTFTMIFERLEHDQPLAAELLTVCAFLAPEAIPEEFFLEGAEYLGPTLEMLATDQLAFQRAIKALLSYSLLQRHGDTHTVTIHRLVQVVLKGRLSDTVQRIWGKRVVEAMTHLFPSEEETQANYWQVGGRLLPHALVCLGFSEQWNEDKTLSISLMNHVAACLGKRAQYAEAESLFERALRQGEQVLGPKHLLVAEVLHGLANLFGEQGKHGEAEPLFQRAIHIREQILGVEHPLVAKSLDRLGYFSWEQGKYEQGERVLLRSIHIFERVSDPRYSLAAAYPLTSLGVLYKQQGKDEQAESLFQRAIYTWEQAPGSDHPQLVFPLNNLGTIYMQQGKYEQAESLYRRAVQIGEQALGPDHHRLALPLHNLGEIYALQGKYEQAEPLFQRALHIEEQAKGSDHPNLAYPLTSLGELYVSQGKYGQAEPLLQRALHMWEQAVGPQYLLVSYPLEGLGKLHLEQGKYQRAESSFLRSLAIRQQHLGQQHPDVAETLHDLAQLRQAQQQDTEALTLYQQALTIREQALGADHPRTRETRTAYAQLLRELGREEEAVGVEGRIPSE
jgi:tetratricopeptide (TPR) repeat protein